MGSRTKARARALQVLYAWDVRGGGGNLADVNRGLSPSGRSRLGTDAREYEKRLLAAIERHRETVDARIEGLSDNWRLARMTTIDRNILRIAATEMLLFDDVPLRVSLQEAILLADWFSTEESGRFVNGVLDSLLQQLEAEQLPDTQ